MKNIEEFLKSLPKLPGIYEMFDNKGNIIYIGKAKDLSKRVPSYFKKNLDRNNQIKKMVTLIDKIEYIVTNNEVEALILENNLIKENLPKYNTLLKDDKTYPYIELTLKEDFPRICISRNTLNKTSKYFGPFPDATAAKEIVELLKKIFKIRSCDNVNLPKKECLYYQIKKCDAPCVNKISKEDYLEKINKCISFLNGNTSDIKKELKSQMEKYAEDLEFEKAKEIRDTLNNIEVLFKKQIITRNKDDKDVVCIKTKEEETLIILFFIRNGKIINKKEVYFKNKEDLDDKALLVTFLERYYLENINIPSTILLNLEIEQTSITLLQNTLKEVYNKKIEIVIPKKGDNFKLIELANKNTELILNEKERKKKTKELLETKGLEELKTLLKISEVNRIEAYDISHLSGKFTVGSMIVYENNKFNKNSYRKFKLEDKNDDFNSLYDLLKRRFNDEKLKETLPSLLLIDGGEEQVNKIIELLEVFSLKIPVVGMVKNDKHQSSYLYFNKENIEFDNFKNAYKLICNIQDETHNFAINYNKILRNKETTKSILDNIKGIGETRKRILLKEFKDINEIKNKSIDDLCKIKGIDKNTATNIFNYYNKK